MKVLIVDDDAMQRMLLADLLHHFKDVEVVEAADGKSAWVELQGGLCPVLCFCDMQMPGMLGVELLRHCKSHALLADIPFIFISASNDRATIEGAIAAGASNYILKPFDVARDWVRLVEIFRSARERYSESPLATQRRMRIRDARLLEYFAAFKRQLADARPSIGAHLAKRETAAAGAQLDTLRTGSIALGLWHAAAIIEHLQPMDAGLVDRVLKGVEEMVDAQADRARSELGLLPRFPGKTGATQAPPATSPPQVPPEPAASPA